MTLHCYNCGGTQIEVGEAGARSKCALCGSTKFAEVREIAHGHTVTTGNPPELHIVPNIICSPEKAHEIFQSIHRFIDAQ